MALKLSICDDSAADRSYLAGLVRRWAGERGIAAELTEYVSAENFLFQQEDRPDTDILLLDIEMGAMDGVALARRLRRDDERTQIVFITGYSDYIAEGYEVSALHYLLKPVGADKLFAVLDRAVDRLRRAERVLTLDLGDQTVRVPMGRVRYADVRLNYTTVHTGGGDYTVKKPLGELAKELDERFYRVGRSAVVNLTEISRVSRTEIVLRDGSSIPLPRGAYEGVNRAIIGLR